MAQAQKAVRVLNKQYRPSAVVRKELAEKQQRYAEIDEEISKLNDAIAALFAELLVLKNNWGYGEIHGLESELDKSLQCEADVNLLQVVWLVGNWGDLYVVDKVTEKRISVRRFGETRSIQFHLNGKPVANYSVVIDIEKTFGIDPLPPNWKGRPSD